MAYRPQHGHNEVNVQDWIELWTEDLPSLDGSVPLVITVILVIILIGILLLIALAIFALIVMIIAGVKAASGDLYRYPLTIRFISGPEPAEPLAD